MSRLASRPKYHYSITNCFSLTDKQCNVSHCFMNTGNKSLSRNSLNFDSVFFHGISFPLSQLSSLSWTILRWRRKSWTEEIRVKGDLSNELTRFSLTIMTTKRLPVFLAQEGWNLGPVHWNARRPLSWLLVLTGKDFLKNSDSLPFNELRS